MVLKFCNGLSAIWGGGSDAATTAAESKELKMRALELLVTDSHDTRWEKEFRVFFDGTRPIGLGFQPAAAPATLPKRSSMAMAPPSRNNSVKFPTNEYDCIVKEVVPGGLAHDYNDKCRAAGDYSRIITDNLRVRRVNHEDMSGVSFDSVLQKCVEFGRSLKLDCER
ncbi:TPA: hypothetical protein N0F65_011926 [Lagenidium giganteum]|uniref:Uncharacterized protein n=1 Tax=Lagenidium giganteum TaxID=4803 RepID=A0AAV2YUF7_9STRA|nr:TPA: hypothetical protein N0F65_011926 [Lagenidium giganteum]